MSQKQPSMPPQIHTVLLDADGVVQTTPRGWLEKLGDLCGRADSTDAFVQDIFAAERPTLIGAGSFRPALAEVLARWDSPVTVEEAIRVWRMIEPQPFVIEQVQMLRSRGVRVSLATNQHPERAAFMTHTLGYADQFDDLFYSCELGHAKPSSDYFSALLAHLRQPAEEVLFVDDNAENVAAAQGVGLHAQIYDLRSGPAGMTALLADHGLGYD